MVEVTKKMESRESVLKLIGHSDFGGVVTSVGGLGNFTSVMGINSLTDLLGLFNNLKMVTSKRNPDKILLMNEGGHVIMIHNKPWKDVSVDLFAWWCFEDFNFDKNKTSESWDIINNWFFKTYGLDVNNISSEYDFYPLTGHQWITG